MTKNINQPSHGNATGQNLSQYSDKLFADLQNKVVIDELPEHIDIEKTFSFLRLVALFNQANGARYATLDILESTEKFRQFSDFVFFHALAKNVVIKPSLLPVFTRKFSDLKGRYSQHLRSMDRYYDEIVEAIYHPQGLRKHADMVKNDMYKFLTAYILMKDAFHGKERRTETAEGKHERYFSHLTGTMEIVFRELPNPNVSRIVIALLHDAKEDLKYPSDFITMLFGEYIAEGVKQLSKLDRKEYLFPDERAIFKATENPQEKEKLIREAKERRNKVYFGHLAQLNDDYLAVKLADRIHNLRTMHQDPAEKIQRKIEETERYFLKDEIEKRMPEAIALIKSEIEKLKLKKGL